MKKIDYSLYLVTDRPLCLGKELVDVVKAAVAGGVTMVQLREKEASTREFLAVGMEIKKIHAKKAVPLIINDRVDIALALEAEGVHLGNNDMSYEKARKILGKNSIIGLSAENVKDAVRASRLGADYIGVSPVYTTPTKPELETGLGLEGLREIRGVTRLPLIAIGGINAANCREAIESGADGVAVVSAVCSAADPGSIARAILSEIRIGEIKRDEIKRYR